MEKEPDVFEDMTEQERVDAAPVLIEMGAIIDVAEGKGDILDVLGPQAREFVEEWGATEEGASTVEFMKIILGVDKPSEGPSINHSVE
jgi:hypothetical protein